MYYTNECLNKRISELTESIFNTFRDKDRVKGLIERDLEEGSSLIQELSDKFRQIAEKNKEIHLIYKKMKEEIDVISSIRLKEIENLIEKKND